MKIRPVIFEDFKLQLDNGLSTVISFEYQGVVQRINLAEVAGHFILYQPGERVNYVSVNEFLPGNSFDMVFFQDNLQDDKDLSKETLFTKYKLGIVEYGE